MRTPTLLKEQAPKKGVEHVADKGSVMDDELVNDGEQDTGTKWEAASLW